MSKKLLLVLFISAGCTSPPAPSAEVQLLFRTEGLTSRDEALLRTVMHEWNTALACELFGIDETGTSAHIIANKGDEGPNGEYLGLVVPYRRGSDEVIFYSPFDRLELHMGLWLDGRLKGDWDLKRAVMRHELGHALGLSHAYDDEYSIMRADLAGLIRYPGWDEIRRLDVARASARWGDWCWRNGLDNYGESLWHLED